MSIKDKIEHALHHEHKDKEQQEAPAPAAPESVPAPAPVDARQAINQAIADAKQRASDAGNSNQPLEARYWTGYWNGLVFAMGEEAKQMSAAQKK